MPTSWSKYALSVNLSLPECPDLELFSSERYDFGYVLDTNPHLAINFVSGVIRLPTPRVWAHNSQQLWRTSTIRNSHASTSVMRFAYHDAL